jgi:8-oxo-dGTP pyrophosphatase MutT (NUDIX family)
MAEHAQDSELSGGPEMEPAGAPRAPLGALDRLLAHREIERLARTLRTRPGRQLPVDAGARRAAVALILRAGEGGGLKLLMIKRAVHEGDPWSGHVALPGGRRERGDPSLEHTAIRETLEETGIDLSREGRILGALDELHPRTPVLPPIVITPFVAALAGDPAVVLSPEVAEAFWVPLEALRNPAATREVVLQLTTGPRTVRSFQHRDYTIWGLTERVLRQFLSYLE